MITICIIILVLCSVALAATTYLGFRNFKVRNFCTSLIEMSYMYEMRRLRDLKEFGTERQTRSAFDWFASKYSYEQFLYSLKPLKLEYWYTEEELKEINR